MTIREIRRLTGLSQQEFGARYGIPKRTIQDWEGEKRTPPPYLPDLLESKVRADIKKESD